MRNRARLVLVSLGFSMLVCCGSVICAAEPSSPKSGGALAQTPDEAKQRLQQLIDVDLLEVPLNELTPSLEQVVGVTVWIDPPPVTRSAGGLFPSAPNANVEKPVDMTFSLRVKQVPAEKALELLLKPSGWEWSLLGATLHLGSEKTKLLNEVYDIRDLTFRGDDARFDEYDFDSLIEVLTSTVEPTTWSEVGGVGSIKAFSGGGRATLVISQTPSAHREVAELLALLRKVPSNGSVPKKLGDARHEQQGQAANRNIPPVADEIPGWWPKLATHMKATYGSILVTVRTREPILPSFQSQVPLYILPSVWISPPPPADMQASLLAWHVVVDDQAYPTLRVLVLLSSNSVHTSILANYEIRLRDSSPYAQRQGNHVVTGRQFEPFRRPPHNKDAYRFLGQLKRCWQFNDLPDSKLVAGNVLAHQWVDSLGEAPEQFYDVSLPRTYERIVIPQVNASDEKTTLARLDDGVSKLQTSVGKLQESMQRLYLKLSSQQ